MSVSLNYPEQSPPHAIRRRPAGRLGFLPLAALGLLALAAPSLTAQSGPDAHPAESVPTASDPTALKIIELHLQARGGRPAIEKLTSLRRDGRVIEGRTEHKLTWLWDRDLGLREERLREHMGRKYHAQRARSGDLAWGQILAPTGSKPRPLKPKEAEEFNWDAMLLTHIYDPFLRGREFGNYFAYIGTQQIGHREAYHLRARLENGKAASYFFDRQSFLILAVGFREDFSGRDSYVQAMPTGVEKVNGVWLENGFNFFVNQSRYRRVEFQSTMPNLEFKIGMFQKPPVFETILGEAGGGSYR